VHSPVQHPDVAGGLGDCDRMLPIDVSIWEGLVGPKTTLESQTDRRNSIFGFGRGFADQTLARSQHKAGTRAFPFTHGEDRPCTFALWKFQEDVEPLGDGKLEAPPKERLNRHAIDCN
jgi:hypothetical protein